MIKYYSSRELSVLLGYNLSRWKRWSREFLPPDPLGGLQSGYARQYSMRESFLVALGGHLVGFLKFSVHQAKTILADLDLWLEKNGYFQWGQRPAAVASDEEQARQNCSIYIRSADEKKINSNVFHYAVSTFRPSSRLNQTDGGKSGPAENILFVNTPEKLQEQFADTPFLVLLCIGQFRRYFLECVSRCPALDDG